MNEPENQTAEFLEEVWAEIEASYLASITQPEQWDYAVWKHGRRFVERTIGPRPESEREG